ncbi:MAG: DNA repair protein RecO [Ruminococcaceae bacterium]|nr:DNA repair protein RecO [Oscillospiraceae bacterium]
MDTVKTRGIIARRADYGESNAMLTVLTKDLGVVSVCAYGVRSGKSKLKAGTQQFCLGDFVLSRKNGEIYRLETVEIAESFYPLCEDFEKLALANYFTEVAADALSEGDERILSLLLCGLYVLAYKDVDADIIKAAFELKTAMFMGYAPQISKCSACGEDGVYFSLSGGLFCKACKPAGSINLLSGTIAAMRYVQDAEDRKVFSFELSEDVKKQFSALCQEYLLTKTEKRYKSLEYYKKIKRK